jgi:hypothetical protein
MHFNAWLTLAFTASAVARPDGVVDNLNRREVLNVANLPAIKGTFEVLTKDGDELDKAIAALTKENVATQIDVIASKLTKLSSDSSAQAAKISKSGAIGLLEISGLLSTANQNTWTALIKETIRVVNQTSIDIMAKRDITKGLEGPKLETLSKAIKSQKKGIMDIVATVPGQIPPAVKNQMSQFAAKAASSMAAQATAGATAPKMPAMPDINDPKIQESLGKAIDGFLDQVVAIVTGKQDAFIMPALPAGVTLPAGMQLPPGISIPGAAPTPAPAAGGMGDMANMPGMAAPAPAPTAPKMPKGTGMPKMPTKGTGGTPKGAKGPAAEFVERRF